jgi:hypothetical protein
MRIILSTARVLLMVSMVVSQTYVFQVQLPGSKYWGYAGIDGQFIIKPKYKICTDFSKQGVALVVYKNVYSIIDLTGEIINCEVDKMRPYINPWTGVPKSFCNGYLPIVENEMWGCIDHDGKLVIPYKYDWLTDFNGGYALAEYDKKFFVVDKHGNEFPVKAEKIKEIKHFSEGMGIIEVKGGKWGFIDSTGQVAIAPQYDGVGYFSAGLAWARTLEGNIGFINKKGEWVIKPQFYAARSFDPESGLAMVKANNQWGYVDVEGNIKIFNETDKTYKFSNGLAIGRKKGKVGFLNNQGEWAIQPQFNSARPFKNGYAAVEIKNLWGLIDKEGNWIVEPTYEHIRDVSIVK